MHDRSGEQRPQFRSRRQIIKDLVSPYERIDVVPTLGPEGGAVIWCDDCEEVLCRVEDPSADIEASVEAHDKDHR